MRSAFSTRTGWDMREGDLAASIRALRAAGRSLIDLTLSNPTTCGFRYDEELILGALHHPAALTYDPDPRGMASARRSVAQYYVDHGAPVLPEYLVLTTSTSEAYAHLFRLLCNTGDEVLVAQPSYPLFEFLADIEDVRLRPYPLFYDHGWWIDVAMLERAISPRTRAILVVHPNNPTGHATRRPERELLEQICERHGLALVVDEVFLDYGLNPAPESRIESFACGPHPVPTYVVSGLSKIAALPQMKVAWIAALGPEEVQSEALARLEIIADTFLSMNAPVQLALPAWLAARHDIQEQIRSRVRANLASLRALDGIEVLQLEAGWCCVVRLPDRGNRDWAGRLVGECGVIVHPGSFYGMGESNRVVLSLLPRPLVFCEGAGRLSGVASEPG